MIQGWPNFRDGGSAPVRRLTRWHGKAGLQVNGEIIPPMAMTTRSQDPRYFRALADAGIRVFFVICDTQWLKPDGLELLRQATGIPFWPAWIWIACTEFLIDRSSRIGRAWRQNQPLCYTRCSSRTIHRRKCWDIFWPTGTRLETYSVPTPVPVV